MIDSNRNYIRYAGVMLQYKRIYNAINIKEVYKQLTYALYVKDRYVNHTSLDKLTT